MKWKHLKLVAVTILLAAMLCAVVYANKHKEEKACLPDAVKATINASYAGAKVEDAEMEHEGIKVYEVELEQNGQELELTIAPDGTIIEVETEVAMESLPEAVAKAITASAGGAKIKEVKKEVTYAVVKLVKLDKTETSYEAELIKDDKKGEVKVAADGTILEEAKWKEHKKHKHGDDDNDKNDDK